MAEYIEKEKLFDCLDIKNALGGHYGISLTAINAIPAADVVEARHAHWSMLSYDEAVCTRCGYNRNTPFDSTREARERWGELPPYCEMCGAKIDGGVNRVDFDTVKDGGVNDGKAD